MERTHLLTNVARAAIAPGKVRVTFRLDDAVVTGPTSVVGNFNDWSPGRHRFLYRGRGIHAAVVLVPEGDVLRLRYLGPDGYWHNPANVPDVDGEDTIVVARSRWHDTCH
jgi:hypothetical protein